MAFLKEDFSPIAAQIYEGLCRHDAQEPIRGYLGMSSLGSSCERQSWYSWRQTSGHITDGRILMLFDTGKHVEMIVCRALRLAGYVLHNAFPDSQLSFSDLGGFLSGHPDGIIEDTDGNMILEVKSCNTNKYKAFQDCGVKEVYPAYYIQTQLYMHYSKLLRALFVAMKKDDSSLYNEIIPYDQPTATAAIGKASRIIQTHDPDGRIRIPERISNDPRSEDCKWCRYTVACFAPEESLQSVQSCRSCAYLTIGPDFKPLCGNNQHKFPLKDISRACPQWAWVMRVPWK